MKNKSAFILCVLFALCVIAAVSPIMPINNGRLQSNMDANGFGMTNGVLPIAPGANITLQTNADKSVTIISSGGGGSANLAASNNIVLTTNAGVVSIAVTGTVPSATTAASVSGAFTGDVTGTQATTVVATVGGVSAANVAAGANAANAATTAATANTIVKRDSSGNIDAAQLAGTVPSLGVTLLAAQSMTLALPATNLPVTIGADHALTNVPSGTNGNFVIADSTKLGGTKFVDKENVSLSTNVPLKTAANTFGGIQTFNGEVDFLGNANGTGLLNWTGNIQLLPSGALWNGTSGGLSVNGLSDSTLTGDQLVGTSASVGAPHLISSIPLSYVANITGDIQAQVNNKQTGSAALTNLSNGNGGALTNFGMDYQFNVVKYYNASGSSNTTTGSIGSGSPTLTVTSAIDFKQGQGMLVLGAGGTQRSVADGVLNSTTNITSATMAFASDDIDKMITGAGIPANTTITSVSSATAAGISVAATASGSGVTFTIQKDLITGIASISGTTLTLSNNASGSVTNAFTGHSDAAAINRAIADCWAANGGIVYFPRTGCNGNYNCWGPFDAVSQGIITFPSNMVYGNPIIITLLGESTGNYDTAHNRFIAGVGLDFTRATKTTIPVPSGISAGPVITTTEANYTTSFNALDVHLDNLAMMFPYSSKIHGVMLNNALRATVGSGVSIATRPKGDGTWDNTCSTSGLFMPGAENDVRCNVGAALIVGWYSGSYCGECASYTGTYFNFCNRALTLIGIDHQVTLTGVVIQNCDYKAVASGGHNPGLVGTLSSGESYSTGSYPEQTPDFFDITSGAGTTNGLWGSVDYAELLIPAGGYGPLIATSGSPIGLHNKQAPYVAPGTVSSVGLSLPSWLTVSVTPVTISGTLTAIGNGNTAAFDSLKITNNTALNTVTANSGTVSNNASMGSATITGLTTNLVPYVGNAGLLATLPVGTNNNFWITDTTKPGQVKQVDPVNLSPAFNGANITGLNLNITNISGISTNGLVTTNVAFALGTVYTNTFGYALEVAAITMKAIEGIVAGQCALTVKVTNGAVVTNYSVNALTVLGQAAGLTPTNAFPTFFVPVAGTFAFSDTSTGSGNSVAIAGGTEAYFSEVIAQGALPTNVAFLDASQTFTGINTFSNLGSTPLDATKVTGAFSSSVNVNGATNFPPYLLNFVEITSQTYAASTNNNIELLVGGTRSGSWPVNSLPWPTQGKRLSGFILTSEGTALGTGTNLIRYCLTNGVLCPTIVSTLTGSASLFYNSSNAFDIDMTGVTNCLIVVSNTGSGSSAAQTAFGYWVVKPQ